MLSPAFCPLNGVSVPKQTRIQPFCPVARGPPAPRRCRASAGNNAGASPDLGLISLPLFPLPTATHPAQSGVLMVFEPRYLELFRSLQQASSAPGTEPSFGHILAGSAAPPALMQNSVGGLPPIGVCATVKQIDELDNGRLQVTYQGSRRFKLLTVDNESQPYPVAAATWLDDEVPTDPTQQQLTDTLELDVYQLLKQIQKYSQQLAAATSQRSGSSGPSSTTAAGGGGQPSQQHEQQEQPAGSSSSSSALPDAVLMYAPPPPEKRSVAEYLIQSGQRRAGDQIATWQRMGSVYGDAEAKKKPAQDPYQLVRDSMCKERRQELFSFAAASVLELGLPERLALLECRNTAARLQFVAVACQPHLQDLVARVSLQQALVKP